MNNTNIEIIDHSFVPKKVSKFRVRQTSEKDMTLKQILALQNGEDIFQTYREMITREDGRDLLHQRNIKLCAKSSRSVSECKNKTRTRRVNRRRERNNTNENSNNRNTRIVQMNTNNTRRNRPSMNTSNANSQNRLMINYNQDVPLNIDNVNTPVNKNRRRETISPTTLNEINNLLKKLNNDVEIPIQIPRNKNKNKTRRARSPVMTRARAREALPVATRTRGRTRRRIR